MAAITREQMLKYAAGWQAGLLLLTWYVNEFGIDTTNRLLFGLSLVAMVVLLYFKQEYGKKDDLAGMLPPDVLASLSKVWSYFQKISQATDKRADSEHSSEKDASEDSEVW